MSLKITDDRSMINVIPMPLLALASLYKKKSKVTSRRYEYGGRSKSSQVSTKINTIYRTNLIKPELRN